MRSFRYVILGGGMVAGYAAKEFVERGILPGQLAIVSADDALPYERPPLSKGFLRGSDTEESVFINNAAFYRAHGVEVKLATPVERVDFASRSLHLGGEEWRFEKLLIATGARVRTLDVPGADLDGVFYLRSLDDSRRIRDRSMQAKRAVVIGGGFIGMEAASSLTQRGLDVTLLVAGARMGERMFTPEISAFFRRYFEARGVKFATGSQAAGFLGDGRVASVRTASGQSLAADMVVAGVGVLPENGLFERTGLAIDNGIPVNEYLETNVPDVYAAGDVANYRDVIFNKNCRVEHWDNAVSQGQHAARAMTGTHEPFVHVPYFFSDVFDLSYEFWGDPAEASQIVTRGDLGSTSFSVWWLKNGQVAAAFVMGRPDDERDAAQQWIRSRKAVSAEALADPGSLLRA